jgi:imidazolonepropionase-like amidohydrolase
MIRPGWVGGWVFALYGATFGSFTFAQNVLIEHVTIVASSDKPPIVNGHVLVKDGRISEVGAGAASAAAAAGVTRVDGRGKFLVPGLMDSHVHLTNLAGLIDAHHDPSPQMQKLREAYFRQQPRSYLYFGVTQVVDLAQSGNGLADFTAQPLHPDVHHCGSVPVVDGYGVDTSLDPRIRHKDTPFYLFEPANAKDHPMPPGDDPKEHTAEAVVQRIAQSGAICVKVFIENGFGEASNLPLISNDSLKRIRAAAHQRGLLVVAHANAIDMLRIAVANDVDVVAHGTWNWLESDRQPGVPEPIAAELREVHRKHMGYQPTQQVIVGLSGLFDPGTLADPVYAQIVPANVLAWYRTDAGSWFKKIIAKDFPPGMSDANIKGILERVGAQGARATKYLFDLGHPLLLGSDTPSAPSYANQPGYNTYLEIQKMARAGIPAPAIFDAATVNNARQFKLERDYGTVEAGKVGNLLLLTGNPLESAGAWGLIDKVILRGKVLERSSLQPPGD